MTLGKPKEMWYNNKVSYGKGVYAMKRLDTEESKQVCYQAGIAALEQYYDRQFELIKKGNTDLVTLELVMLGKALDFVHLVRTRLGIELQTAESSVKDFEEVVDAFTRGVVQDNFFADETGIAKSMAAYFGLLMIANIGGTWEDTESGAAVNINGRSAYVDEYVERRLLGLSNLDALTFYNSVKLAR